MDRRGARSLVLAMLVSAAGWGLGAPARGQTPPAEPPAGRVAPEAPPSPGLAEPPPLPAEPPPAPAPLSAQAPPAPLVPPSPPEVPPTLPSTWGPEESVSETPLGPVVPRPRLSAAIGMGSSLDSVGFSDGNVHNVPAFFMILEIGERQLLGLDLSAFASSATRSDRMTANPIDRLGVDLFGVARPLAWYRPDDHGFNARFLRALAVELGLGLERDGRSAVSGTRFVIHTGARADIPLTPPTGATELRLRLGARRGFGLYTPKLYGASRSDFTEVADTAAELYAALVVVF
jgi:hypothetical protein